MLLLDALLLSSTGAIAPLGKFLHAPDRPDGFDATLDADGARAVIIGASLADLDELAEPVLEVRVSRRERAPICGTASTRLYSLDRASAEYQSGRVNPWTRLDALRVGESVRIPERTAHGLIVSWGRIVDIRRAVEPGRAIWAGTPKVAGTLKLARGHWSFACGGAFVHV